MNCTNTACAGHCRRRKIRCLLPNPEDSHGRCANCIRLKKECNFFPVDQAVLNDQRLQNGNKKETSSSVQSASAQSSPRISALSQQSSIHDGAQGQVQSTHPVQDIHHESDSPRYGVHSVTEGTCIKFSSCFDALIEGSSTLSRSTICVSNPAFSRLGLKYASDSHITTASPSTAILLERCTSTGQLWRRARRHSASRWGSTVPELKFRLPAGKSVVAGIKPLDVFWPHRGDASSISLS